MIQNSDYQNGRFTENTVVVRQRKRASKGCFILWHPLLPTGFGPSNDRPRPDVEQRKRKLGTGNSKKLGSHL